MCHLSVAGGGKMQNGSNDHLPHLRTSFHCFTSLPFDSADTESICLSCENRTLYHTTTTGNFGRF
jgi:hypothetical protein